MRIYGQSYHYWQRTLTFPLWRSMIDEQLDHPTLDDFAASYFKYKRPPKAALKKHALKKLPEFEP